VDLFEISGAQLLKRQSTDDDHRDFSDRDPAKLLPFVCELMPHDPSVEELPRRNLVVGQEPRADEPDDESIAAFRD
jgi:hypothetical protein